MKNACSTIVANESQTGLPASALACGVWRVVWRRAALIACGVQLALAEDWPQWRGPNRNGVWSETGILQTFPAKGLEIRWHQPVGVGWSSPVVAQGRVFLTDAIQTSFRRQNDRSIRSHRMRAAIEAARPAASSRLWFRRSWSICTAL